MINTSSTKQIRGVVRAILGVSTAAVCTPLFAQTAPAADAQGDQLQEVVVTGIRASLQKSMAIKENAIGVVDAISAEDIGQFPDANIGDAIARIPGVTVNRGSLNYSSAAGAPTATGATQGINVRGFGGSFNEVLLEGRPIASGNGQTFNFSDFSAVYVGEVDVLKTPDMALSSGTIGATVNVKFPNPLDQLGFHAQLFGQADDHSLANSVRPGFGALVSDTFADGRFGILLDFDYLDSHIEGHHQDVVGWKGASYSAAANGATGGYLACTSFATAPAGSGCGTAGITNSKVPTWYPQDMAMYLENTDSRRKDGRVAVQLRPTDSVLITLDDNYSSDNEHDARWQRSTWFNSFPGAVQDANGTLTSFNFTGPTDFNAFVAENYIVTNTPGINVKWDVSEHWAVALDADQSDSKYNPNNGYTDIDADVGFGGPANSYTGGLVLASNGNTVPFWSAYGPGAVANGSGTAVAAANSNGLSPFIIGSHVLPLQSQQNTDKINQAKLEGTFKTADTKVNFGIQFVDDLWNQHESDTFTNNYWQLWSGYGPSSGTAGGQALPPNLFQQVNVSPWLPGFSGESNLPSSLLKYNPYAVLSYLITQPINAGFNPGTYPMYTGGIPAEALSNSSVQHVDRTNYSPFVTAQENLTLGSMSLVINAGMRYQKTNETIAGLSAPLIGVAWEGTGDPSAYLFSTGTPTWTQVTTSYHYFLPSLDLNLLITPELKVRADFSRTEVAPPNGSLIPNTSYGGRVNALTAKGNNPGLLPFLSNNFDLGAEWYYGANSYVSADVFFKHVTNFPTSSVQNVTVPINDPAPAINPNNGGPLSSTTGQPLVFSETTTTNGLAANVHGLEFTLQQMLAYGFGLQLNGTYVHTNRNFNNGLYSPGSSQFALTGVGNSANFIGFYDAHGLQARLTVQWQGSQLLGLGQEQGGGAFGAEPVYLAGSTELDFSTQYQFTKQLSGYFEALNLTDTVYHSYGRFSNQTLNLVEYGRTFTLGVRAKF